MARAKLFSWTGSFTARRHLLGVNLHWSYAPAEVKVLTSLDGGNFEEAAGWRQIAHSEPSFEETIMFAAPVAAKAVKVLMRGAKPWGYFGLSGAAGVRRALFLHAGQWRPGSSRAVCGVFWPRPDRRAVLGCKLLQEMAMMCFHIYQRRIVADCVRVLRAPGWRQA